MDPSPSPEPRSRAVPPRPPVRGRGHHRLNWPGDASSRAPIASSAAPPPSPAPPPLSCCPATPGEAPQRPPPRPQQAHQRAHVRACRPRPARRILCSPSAPSAARPRPPAAARPTTSPTSSSTVRSLHLQGHDHHVAGEARRMEMAESRALARRAAPTPGEWGTRPVSASRHSSCSTASAPTCAAAPSPERPRIHRRTGPGSRRDPRRRRGAGNRPPRAGPHRQRPAPARQAGRRR